mgnify:CR=1 FL=1
MRISSRRLDRSTEWTGRTPFLAVDMDGFEASLGLNGSINLLLTSLAKKMDKLLLDNEDERKYDCEHA